MVLPLFKTPKTMFVELLKTFGTAILTLGHEQPSNLQLFLLPSDSQAVCISISNTILRVDVKFLGEFSTSDPRLFIAAC